VKLHLHTTLAAEPIDDAGSVLVVFQHRIEAASDVRKAKLARPHHGWAAFLLHDAVAQRKSDILAGICEEDISSRGQA
jgi:hypothetical protein